MSTTFYEAPSDNGIILELSTGSGAIKIEIYEKGFYETAVGHLDGTLTNDKKGYMKYWLTEETAAELLFHLESAIDDRKWKKIGE